MRVTMEKGRSVRLPVATAAGSVDDCVLKYAPNGQPSQHLLRYWQFTRFASGCVMFAVRPMIRRRESLKAVLIRAATCFSTTFSSIGGMNWPCGGWGRVSIGPLQPAHVWAL